MTEIQIAVAVFDAIIAQATIIVATIVLARHGWVRLSLVPSIAENKRLREERDQYRDQYVAIARQRLFAEAEAKRHAELTRV